MKDSKTLDRREFTVASAMAVLSGVAITISSCGGSSSGSSPTTPSTPAPPPAPGDEVGTVSVSAGHSHTAVITAAELTAGGALSLTITGSGHTHTVELTADDIVAIAGGQTVARGSSSTEAHTHTVTFN